jgi:hypothetical protein
MMKIMAILLLILNVCRSEEIEGKPLSSLGPKECFSLWFSAVKSGDSQLADALLLKTKSLDSARFNNSLNREEQNGVEVSIVGEKTLGNISAITVRFALPQQSKKIDYDCVFSIDINGIWKIIPIYDQEDLDKFISESSDLNTQSGIKKLHEEFKKEHDLKR